MAESWSWSWSSWTGARPLRISPARVCAAPGCGAWADVAAGGLALCRDHAEAFARAYGILEAERHPVTGGER
jgi:hypothetical protein